ncbi:major facilitator superfamily domain-containing protein [Epithele typhae]|uniref:major facilitator superfamily domain-containing protein n=1 Tax=Epithele typhae TaxID=378194 RepID=UPI0020083CF5|nr:major facilitator superfamily domain-containing protein [Epithele typhae]KAH9913476.1 major facilitator superfamily domain-containing protein [Epithele typhae]
MEKSEDATVITTEDRHTPTSQNATGAADLTMTEPGKRTRKDTYLTWSNILGAFLLQVCGFGYTTSFGVYQDYYTRVYLKDSSSSLISWVGSINAFIVISAGLVTGPLYDRGYFYHLLYGGSLVTAISLFMLSLAQQGAYYQIFLAQGVGAGIGGGLLYIPAISAVSARFTSGGRARATALTLVASGSSVGAVVHPIMLNSTLQRWGFEAAARANAALITGVLVVGCALMRDKSHRKSGSSPQWRGLWKLAGKFIRDGPYVCTSAGMMIFIVAYYYPVFYIQLDAYSTALVIMNVAAIVGRIAPGFVAGRIGVAHMSTFATFACSVVIFGMIGLQSATSVIVIAILLAFSAAVISLFGTGHCGYDRRRL